ncbi:hypothetical protein [Rhizobium leguminosarum]|uniref:hypothetical protein n=1 Tax=Rhizobium leguminosarum TaxID=384 RepID=UPI001C90A667|nr:hypothetical protein [Rhizobium leguminosarum]MBY3027109.1 hypothetical protein [Rhizobium leguminosarum]
MKFKSEQSVQDWVQSLVDADGLRDVIDGVEELNQALVNASSDEFWPDFPIDYLTRLRNLEAARDVLSELFGLELVSKNSANLSRTKGESLFADLLYCRRETSHFVIMEIKNRKASARETITELLAYEQELLNHMPFSGSHDVLFVVVSRDFPTLLDHGLTSLTTWNRRKILCLKLDDDGESPRLKIHIPNVWAPVGQSVLPRMGISTAYLRIYPATTMDSDQIYAVCKTAMDLLVREAERGGGSGFAMIASDHLYPKLSSSPYVIIAGVVNPYSFLPHAETQGFVERTTSAVSQYLLDPQRRGDLTYSWGWLDCDRGSARSYLSHFGRPAWEGFGNWSDFRDPRRWRHPSLTPDRHLTPVFFDFWGVLGDFARDIVKTQGRLRAFIPGFAKPGLDWHYPHLGVLLLDDIAVTPAINAGQWTFAALFDFGIRLGRFCAISAQYADADDRVQKLLQAGLFWAEADITRPCHEAAWRYLSALEITTEPPRIPIGAYESGAQQVANVSSFANWIVNEFIGAGYPLLQDAFATGLSCYALFDPQFDPFGTDPSMPGVKRAATARARDWLRRTLVRATSEDTALHSRRELAARLSKIFDGSINVQLGQEAGLAAVDAFPEPRLIENLFEAIPALVSLWHPQLAHTLAPLAHALFDWDWFEQQVRERRSRGVKNPCVYLSANGGIGVGEVPETYPTPHITDTAKEVLFVDNQTSAEIMIAVTWEALRAGKFPSSGHGNRSPIGVNGFEAE